MCGLCVTSYTTALDYGFRLYFYFSLRAEGEPRAIDDTHDNQHYYPVMSNDNYKLNIVGACGARHTGHGPRLLRLLSTVLYSLLSTKPQRHRSQHIPYRIGLCASTTPRPDATHAEYSSDMCCVSVALYRR